MDAGPGGGLRGQSAIVVAAAIVDVPAQVGGIEIVLVEPVVHGDAVERGVAFGEALLHGDCEPAGLAKSGHELLEALVLFVVAARGPDGGLERLLPASVEEQPFLRRVAEPALVPVPSCKQAEFLAEFADQRRSLCPGRAGSVPPTGKRETSFSPERELPPAWPSIRA